MTALGVHDVALERTGVVPTVVRAASISRFEMPDTPSRDKRLRSGQVSSAPLASSSGMEVHLARDLDGTPAFVIRGREASIDRRLLDLGFVSTIAGTGVFSIPLLGRRSDGLWLDRSGWVRAASLPDEWTVTEHIFGVIRAALADGAIVATGASRVVASGRIESVEVFIASHLEPDQRSALASILRGLLALDPIAVVDGTSRLCRVSSSKVLRISTLAVAGLSAQYSAFSLGMSLHQIACAAAPTGPAAEPLVLLADEMLHRLDLAHRLRLPLVGIGALGIADFSTGRGEA